MLASYDLDLIRRDIDLPGLHLALVPGALAEALRAAWPALDPLRLEYVRYKPGMNGLFAYRIGSGNEAPWMYAKVHRRADRVKLEKAEARRTVPVDGRPGRVVLPEVATVASLFPNDSKLRSLRRFGEASARERLLQRVLPDQPAPWAGELDVLRYKPERRCVLRLRADGVPRVVLKQYTEAGYARALRNSRAFIDEGPLRIVPRAGRSGRHRILAFDWVDGRLLSEALGANTAGRATLEDVGAALARLHRQEGQALDGRGTVAETTQARAVAQHLSWLYPPFTTRAVALAERLSWAMERLPASYAPLHGDFYAKQVLLGAHAVTFLDFDASRLGDPALDLGNFIAHLERDRLRGRLDEEVVGAACEALLAGYRSVTPGLDEARLKVYTALGLFHLAPHPFRFQEPDWPARIEALLDRAEGMLAPTPQRVYVRSKPASEAPHDPKMPFLQEALDPAAMQPHLDRIKPARLEGRRLVVRNARLLRHKPARRGLIEYEITVEPEDGAPEQIRWLGKARAKGLDERTFALMQSLWAGGFGKDSAHGVSVPEPIGLVPDLHMWVQRAVPGVLATRRLESPGAEVLACRIATALHRLHQAGPPSPRRHTLADELRILHERVPRVAERHPAWRERLARVLEAADRLGAGLDEPAPGPIHRDVYPDQVLVHGARLYLLDFDLYCMGDPALDAGNFIGHLVEQGLRCHGDAEALGAVAEAFEEAFVAEASRASRSRVRAYTTLTLVRHIAISNRMPGRRPWTAALLDLCEQRLRLASAGPSMMSIAAGGF